MGASQCGRTLAAYLLGLGLGVWLITIGFGNRALGGRVIIGNGFVRIYKQARAKTPTLTFEAPYSAFREVRVVYWSPTATQTAVHRRVRK